MTIETNTNERAKAYTLKGVVSDLMFRPTKKPGQQFATMKITNEAGTTYSVAAFAAKALNYLRGVQNGQKIATLALFERQEYEVAGVKKTGRNVRVIWAGEPLPPKAEMQAAA
jgi:hypothetical protein